MNSAIRFVPDAANAIRAADAAAIVADAVISAGPVVSPIGAIWNDEVRDGKVVFFLKVSALVGTGTYDVNVITSANADLSSPVVHSSKTVTADGFYDILVDQHSLVDENPEAKYYGLQIDVGGTTPSVVIEAYVLPPVGK